MSPLVSQLDALLDQFVSHLKADPLFGPMLEGTISRPHLIALYTQIWHCLRVSTPALRAAGESIVLYGRGTPPFTGDAYARFRTPLYRELAGELMRHGAEEAGHDDWMLNDLVVLGVSAETVRRSPCGTAMAAYVAGIRQAAVSPTPLGVAGQAYMLEGISELLWASATANLVARSGIPGIEGAVYCLREHATADIGHGAAARRRLRRIEDPRDVAAIVHNARLTIETWGMIGHEALRREATAHEESLASSAAAVA